MSHFQEEIALLKRLGLDVDNRLSVISYEAAEAMIDELKQIIHNDRTIGAINPSYCIAVIEQKKALLPEVTALRDVINLDSVAIKAFCGKQFHLDTPDLQAIGYVNLTQKASMASKSPLADYAFSLKIIEKEGVAKMFLSYSQIIGSHLICALPASELTPMKDKVKMLLAEPVQTKSPSLSGLH